MHYSKLGKTWSHGTPRTESLRVGPIGANAILGPGVQTEFNQVIVISGSHSLNP